MRAFQSERLVEACLVLFLVFLPIQNLLKGPEIGCSSSSRIRHGSSIFLSSVLKEANFLRIAELRKTDVKSFLYFLLSFISHSLKNITVVRYLSGK